MASRHNIYQGPNSCYAIKEGIYVKGHGVSFETAVGISALILNDLQRGYTYDHYCNVVPMDERLAKKRIGYLYALSLRHHPEDANKVFDLIQEIYSLGMKLPRKYWELLPKVIEGLKLKIRRPKIRIVRKLKRKLPKIKLKMRY